MYVCVFSGCDENVSMPNLTQTCTSLSLGHLLPEVLQQNSTPNGYLPTAEAVTQPLDTRRLSCDHGKK